MKTLEAERSVLPAPGPPPRRGAPPTLADSPSAYPWPADFLLVRPGKHIAGRAADPAVLDIETAVGLRPVRVGISGI